jgi:8-oxo-dGTP pyrophosphatase MutT (NUDIX family)
MKQMHVVMALIKQDDEYLLQHRTGPAAIGAAGLIGCFGGKIEESEKTEAALLREISEETTLSPKIEDLEYFDSVNVESDWQGQPIKVKADVFSIAIDASAKIDAKEGQMVKMSLQEAKSRLDDLTPATRELFKSIEEN